MADFRLDDAFITYRYARNLMAGNGLVYNPGRTSSHDRAAVRPAAGRLSLLTPISSMGGLVGALSIAWAGIDHEPAAGRVPFGLAPGRSRLYPGLSAVALLGMETPLWIGLVLAAIWAASRERWAWSGLLAGRSIPVRPDAALPGLLLGLGSAGRCLMRVQTRSRPWEALLRFGLAAALPSVLFWGVIWIGYGSPLPATLGAKHAHDALGITGLGPGVDTGHGLLLMGESLLRQSGLYLIFGGLIVLGLWGGISAPAPLVILWGILHLAA